MFSAKIRVVVLGLSVLALAGCSKKNGESNALGGLAWFQDAQRVTGPDPLIDPDSFEKIDLAVLLDPEIKGFKVPTTSLVDQRRKLEEAFKKFYDERTEKVRDRNRIQERVIAASNQRCGQYKNFIKQFDAAANLTLGGLTTVLAGAGAIFTNVDVVRALSGAASIFSGLRAEVNEAYFQNLTIQVITDGFESKRREIYEEIVKKRANSTSLVDYTVENAVGDAIVYHQHCSLIAGLEQAALSIQRAENPGVKAINKTLKQLTATRAWMDVVTGEKPVSDALETELAITSATKMLAVGDRPWISLNNAVRALNDLRYAKKHLINTEWIIRIKKTDLTKEQKELHTKITDFHKTAMAEPKNEGKGKGKDILRHINTVIATAIKKNKEGKDKIGEYQKRATDWDGNFARQQALTTDLRIERLKINEYYNGLIKKWKKLTNEATEAIRKMAQFRAEARKLGLKKGDLEPKYLWEEKGTDAGSSEPEIIGVPLEVKDLPKLKTAAKEYIGALKEKGDALKTVLDLFARSLDVDPKQKNEDLINGINSKIGDAKKKEDLAKFCLAVGVHAGDPKALLVCGEKKPVDGAPSPGGGG